MKRPKLVQAGPAFTVPGLITAVHYFSANYPEEFYAAAKTLVVGPDEEVLNTQYGRVVVKKGDWVKP